MSGDTPIGMTFASLGALGAGAIAPLAAEAASLGYRSIWTAETVGTEAFATLATAAAAAPGVGLGTGVLALQLRSAPLAAMGAATLQAIHPDREVLLGVGISSPTVTERWHGVPYGDHPLARTREYLEVIRAAWTGEAVNHEGRYQTIRRFRLGVRMGDRRPRLVLGALNGGMLRLAGELADGVLLNYLPASAVPWCIDAVREGERRGGRTPGSCRIYAYVHVSVTERDEAAEPARRDLFSYAVVDAYADAFTRAGFGDEVGEARAAHAAGDRAGAVAAISDRMVDAINVVGDARHVADTVAGYVDAGVEVPIVMAMPWGPDRAATVRATLEAAAGGARR